MFCTNCGKEIDEKAIICPHCGVLVQKYTIIRNDNSTNDDKNEVGIVGMIFSLVGILLLFVPILVFIVELIGLICGCVGMSRAKEIKGKGKGFSIASIVISTTILLVWFVLTILSLSRLYGFFSLFY